MPPVYHSLRQLKLVKAWLDGQAAAQRAAAAEEAARQQALQQEDALFARSVGPVRPVKTGGRVQLAVTPPPPLARQRQRDHAAVLQESLSDAMDVSTLLETDETLSYRQPGIGPDVVRKLRRGDWSIQAELDLHGMRRDAARQALGAFVRDCQSHDLRCVRIITGKGLGSPGREPVIKQRMYGWLIQKREVLAFVQARPADGGAGALVVLLAARRG